MQPMNTENVTTGPMTVDVQDIVARARVLNWTPEMLMGSFNEMPVDVAAELLAGTLVMNQAGQVHPTR